MKKKKKEEVIDEIVAVVNITIGDDTFIVPVDNWNKAVEEGRTKPVVVGEELHFFTPEDYDTITKALLLEKNKKWQV
jgi:hypothetical protein